ncbi:Flp family type IVb pilin [Limnobacter humi]|uniref:Flp family type IVb pilin n=1 Tax=Limnobacter humi TaxID=1778671 RepID=A0ABT1WBP6_9BURK|nr:Flp family type IVb pilin [Limnobacter humi]MCQ8894925.1 Flp family type IVb pilin [Limnobacter humi]
MKYQLMAKTAQHLRKQDGASLIEYAVLAALIVVAAVVAINALGGGISTVFTNILNALDGTP